MRYPLIELATKKYMDYILSDIEPRDFPNRLMWFIKEVAKDTENKKQKEPYDIMLNKLHDLGIIDDEELCCRRYSCGIIVKEYLGQENNMIWNMPYDYNLHIDPEPNIRQMIDTEEESSPTLVTVSDAFYRIIYAMRRYDDGVDFSKLESIMRKFNTYHNELTRHVKRYIKTYDLMNISGEITVNLIHTRVESFFDSSKTHRKMVRIVK